MTDNKEFYIGWMDTAPTGIAKYVRSISIILGIAVVLAGITLALLQRKFSTARFEFGTLTEVKGVYQRFPVPSVKTVTKADAFGNVSYLTIPLVGYGKHGVEGLISDLEHQKNLSLDQMEVVFKGTLLYSDGKTMLQVDQNDHPLISVSKSGKVNPAITKELGNVTLTGEILDPKCYFGVMKPGQGKPHRDCAIRCLDGGMSPVFCIRNEEGIANYCLIVGANGEKINEQLEDYIAEPVSLKARAVQYDDWTVLYLDGKQSITRLGGWSWFKVHDGVVSCGGK